MNETGCIFYSGCISSWIRTVKRQVECEIREFLFYFQEVLQIEHFVQSTCTIEIRHLAICSLQRLSHVHNLSTQRSHTGTTADPHHFSLRVEDRMEITVRTAHCYLVTRFQGKDIRRSDTRHYILESRTLFSRFERRSSDTYSQHDTVAFSRIVSH